MKENQYQLNRTRTGSGTGTKQRSSSGRLPSTSKQVTWGTGISEQGHPVTQRYRQDYFGFLEIRQSGDIQKYQKVSFSTVRVVVVRTAEPEHLPKFSYCGFGSKCYVSVETCGVASVSLTFKY